MGNSHFLPLSAWVNRSHPLPSRFYRKNHKDIPNKNWDVWVGLEESCPLHQINSLNWQSLKQSRNVTKKYLSDAGKIIGGLSGGWLDSEEREMILAEIGEPPEPCLPIYIISTGKDDQEVIQYVGKTKSDVRFKGGHPTALKLHDPQFNNLDKNIYRCCVWFHFKDEYIALEWIQPEAIALALLDTIESKLIFSLKPPLNIQKKKKINSKWDFDIHIQNFSGNKFLNDQFIWD